MQHLPSDRLTQATASAALHVQVFGDVSLRNAAGQSSVAVSSRHHVKCLLALLASSHDALPRDALLEALWPGRDAAGARNRLYHTVHLLKAAIVELGGREDWLAFEQGELHLANALPSDARVVAAAAAQLQRGELPAPDLDQALALSSVHWAPGLQLGELGQTMRAQFVQSHLALWREAAERALSAQHDEAARRALAVLLQAEPALEWAHQQCMRLDLQAERWQAVLQRWREMRQRMAERLGLRPSAVSAALVEQAEQALSASTASALQRAAKPALRLIGREEQITQFGQALRGAPGLWNLHGLPGIGKTSLMRELSWRHAGDFPDGIVEVELGQIEGDESAIDVCCRRLRLVVSAGESAAQRLTRVLGSRRLLLVVDDADGGHELPALIDVLAEARARGPWQAGVLLITRVAVQRDAIVNWPLPPLALPPSRADARQAADSPAVQLFLARCPLVPTAADAAFVEEVSALVRQLDGVPLAIEFAAARTASMTPGEVLHEIRSSLMVLAETAGAVEARHPSMDAALDWSAGLLSSNAHPLYLAASIFADTFSQADLHALCDSDVSAAQVLDALHEMQRAGLLRARGAVSDAADGMPRWQMLHLPRAHARAKARAAGRWHTLLDRRTEALHRQLIALPVDVESRDACRHILALMALHDDVLGVLAHAHTHHPLRFIDMVCTVSRTWTQVPLVDLGLRWLPRALALAREHDLAAQEVQLACSLVTMLYFSTRIAEAETLALAAHQRALACTEAAYLVQAVSQLGVVWAAMGRVGDACRLVDETIHALDLGPHSPGYWALIGRVWSMRWLGATFEGPEPSQAAIEALRPRLEGSSVWVQMLSVACSQANAEGDFSGGVRWADELARLGLEMNSTLYELAGRHNGGESELLLGHDAQAARLWQRGALIARRGGMDKIACDLQTRLCTLAVWQGDLDRATEHLNLADGMRAPSREGDVPSLPALRGQIAFLRGDLRGACNALGEAMPLLSQRHASLAATSVQLGAMLAQHMGLRGPAEELSRLLRAIDVSDHAPAARRFREQHLAPAQATEGVATSPEYFAQALAALAALLPALLEKLAQTRA